MPAVKFIQPLRIVWIGVLLHKLPGCLVVILRDAMEIQYGFFEVLQALLYQKWLHALGRQAIISAVTSDVHNDLTGFSIHQGSREIYRISRYIIMRKKERRATKPFAKPIWGHEFVLTVPDTDHGVNIESEGILA